MRIKSWYLKQLTFAESVGLIPVNNLSEAMVHMVNSINISAFINSRGIGRFQKWVLTICFLISLVDGLDAQISSVTVPAMARDLGLAPNEIGLIFSASQLGALIGAFVFGFCADRWGRRPVIILCAAIFSLGTLATMWCGSFATVLCVRLCTGIGIGGALPSYVALATEYAPRRRRGAVRVRMYSFHWTKRKSSIASSF
ncbi:MFS transporter [Bradyrhizobium sp. KBS0727]|nr:MFS transporter [Bradyrhizobium sp. KBS0725]QDW44493.1 MFS transporter [Bradyrhizobium sp. KBS0727]